jgi:nucleoside recognition membrane protein YjiH
MFDTIFGIPVHPLAVHATVVLVPAAAILVAVAALWPAARDRLGWITPIVAAVALVLIPISTQSGERLEARVARTDLVRAHTQMADGLLPFVALMVVAVGAMVYLSRRGPLPRVVRLTLAVVCVAASLATVVQVVRIGHSGAVAVWQQVGAQTPSGGR